MVSSRFLGQTRHFVRTGVIPREQEILDNDRVPNDLRDQAKRMGLFGYAIPQEWGGLGLNLVQDVEMATLVGADGNWRRRRLLRTDRAGSRIEPGRAAHQSRSGQR
ncbi:hypothetical protein BST45_15690 [Mycobacterium shinjukuense]|uniref:Uncharacterized protein n=1 Tax=Mycobacterium shinjukuense TaxID=398694 RepID=A0A7I7MKH4_9MYCO|nr:hypothetical protein BST45_15690 [Mycobacterium shinjukuense]BBX72665.1 hypothetical protein MSHI_05710 [Mycobacterium shinjukuense]